MQVIQISEYGDVNVLQLKDLPKPKLGADEALVCLKAAGLNFVDIYMRKGLYPRPLPFVPGLEGAGVVEAIGSDVTEVKVGDRVAYTDTLGSFSEYNTIKANKLIPLPNGVSFEEGAAFPLQGITAQYLLHEFYKVNKGDNVLVHAAAGGMGLLLVQWLKHLGATVFGTVSTEEKFKTAKEAGADHIILYTQKDFVEEVKKITNNIGVDYIIDGVGKTTFTKNLDALKVCGHVCLYGSASGPADPLAPNALQTKSLTVSGGSIFNFLNTREELLRRANAVLEGVQEGWLKLKIDHVYPLQKAKEAQTMLENRNTTGKVILTM